MQTSHIAIIDFGLAKQLNVTDYFCSTKEEEAISLPVRWMPPESLENGIFRYDSDVWSFGVRGFPWDSSKDA